MIEERLGLFCVVRLYDAVINWFTSVDPLAADFTSWSPYNYVFGNPVRLIDPDGRAPGDPPLYDVQIDKGTDVKTANAAALAVADELISRTSSGGLGIDKLKAGSTQLKRLNTAGIVMSIHNDESLSSDMKSNKYSALAIGEVIGLSQPIIGFSVGFLLDDATNPGSLTNLDNDRLADTYSQSHDQTEAGNLHMIRTTTNSSEEASPQMVTKYYKRNYAEIDVATGRTSSGRVKMSRQRYYEGSDMYNTLSSPSNSNQSTAYGTEVHSYQLKK